MKFRFLLGSLALLAFVGAGCARETSVNEAPAAQEESAPPLSVTIPPTNEAVAPTPSGTTLTAEAPEGSPPEMSAEGAPPPVAPVPPPPPSEPELKTETPASSPSQPSSSVPTRHVVVMDSTGFVPSTLTVPVGTTVTFLNQGSSPRWPASGVHPTHLLCPGFDSLGGIAPGASYSFTFLEKKTCPLHDHLNPGTRGSIIVE